MKLTELQTTKFTHNVHLPFALSTSEDDQIISMATDKGVYIIGERRQRGWSMTHAYMGRSILFLVVAAVVTAGCVEATDMTNAVFAKQTDLYPAAFGDFNSDEYPDLFVIRRDRKTVEVMLGGDNEPLVRSAGLKCVFKEEVTSVVPGDYDGDAVMDVLVMTRAEGVNNTCKSGDVQGARVLWGGGESLNCSTAQRPPILYFCGQPLAMDFNQDMIIDLFGLRSDNERIFLVFSKFRDKQSVMLQIVGKEANRGHSNLRHPHSHAFLDYNGDSNPDLFITAEDKFEVWLKDKGQPDGFTYTPSLDVKLPVGLNEIRHVGQALFLDIELKGNLDLLLPVCFSSTPDCRNSTIYAYSSNKWHNLKISFQERGETWGFIPPDKGSLLSEAITLRGGDINMDGYPDLLVSLTSGSKVKTYLLKNIKCTDCQGYGRTFAVAWYELDPLGQGAQLGAFYDFMQDGILDVIFAKVSGPSSNPTVNVTAFKNTLDYDANFIKVMVITSLKDKKQPIIPPSGRKDRTYGTNLPGPRISYNSTGQEDEERAAVAAQLPQSAHLSLHLPYTLFGLGRSPNFVDRLNVGVSGFDRNWTQIIPNSQMVVIPIPLGTPTEWTVRLFVTPSKLIVKSFIALLGTCLLLGIIIMFFWWKERREDEFERSKEPLYHFEGM